MLTMADKRANAITPVTRIHCDTERCTNGAVCAARAGMII